MECGLISAQQFERAALSFAQLWEACSDAEQLWARIPSGNKLDAGYLHLKGVPRKRGSSSKESSQSATPLCSPDDSDEAVAWQPPAVHLYSFSIVYQSSYGVPVLLFQGRGPDGAPLSWEETLSDLPEASRETARRGEARWSFITQQEHPVTRVPMHGMHPCETAKLMSLLLAQDCSHATGEFSGAGRQHAKHPHQSTTPTHTGSAELSTIGSAVTEGGEECARAVGKLPYRSEELRYMCGWYSIVAPVVGLPLPLGMYSNCRSGHT